MGTEYDRSRQRSPRSPSGASYDAHEDFHNNAIAERNRQQTDAHLRQLFGRETTDEKYGTDAHSQELQVIAMRAHLANHLSQFGKTVAIATKLSLGGLAGMGTRVKLDKYGVATLAKTAGKMLSIAWQLFGESKVGAVVDAIKGELLGEAKDYVGKAQDMVKELLPESGENVSISSVTSALSQSVSGHADQFVERAKERFANADPKALASLERLVSGTAEAMKGDGLPVEQQNRMEAITTDMLEKLTGIKVGGDAAERLANTIRQQALADLATVIVGADARAEAVQAALTGDVPEGTRRIAEDSGDRAWMERDKKLRASVQ